MDFGFGLGALGRKMNDMTAPTIYACATAPGRAALAVVRVSGPDCQAVLAGFGATCPPPRLAGLRRLVHPHSQDLLDEALILYFSGPHSYTGEDVVELHLHGGAAVVASVLEALSVLPNCRPAEAGEFTRRAVLLGKLDFTRAEAVADLIDAETTAQQVQALGQLQGNLRDLFEGWRGELHTALAHLEADLEFADEDLPGGIGRAALGALPDLRDKIAAFIDDTRGLKLRAGLRVALLGAPNAGKSSLLNRLAGRDAAIVSARAGTTRDIIEIAMTLAGVPVTLIDTAGLRAAGDDIEREGVRRALAAARDDAVRRVRAYLHACVEMGRSSYRHKAVASVDAAIRSRNSSRSRVCPSPVEPPTATPWAPFSISHLIWRPAASNWISPCASNGVVAGGITPCKVDMRHLGGFANVRLRMLWPGRRHVKATWPPRGNR